MDHEAQRTEVVADLLGGLGRGGLRVLQVVFQAQRVPLVLAQLVEGQDLDTVDDILPAGDDLTDRADVLGVVRQARNQDKTNPDACVPSSMSRAAIPRPTRRRPAVSWHPQLRSATASRLEAGTHASGFVLSWFRA